ncbi:carbohydrate ABC transporter permease [Paenibacillus sp. LHD-38]|uniref:carbohydrate ABC transporter permease n=1 Tax=Paenibacillus sp. LHD-38 TaxID=3072143 RepID=UPI00280D32AE|nr:carbohydrate ABC transporter permease [Paenibacillus sp. LHD-38]MDQ8735606.1 carbohydrate ABC transporter permease [Paenibacillus sp. LHD-38]
MISLSFGERVLQTLIIILLCIVAVIALVPLISVLSVSFSSRLPVELNAVSFWPQGFTLDSWKYVLDRLDLWRSFTITLVSTVIGTVLSLLITALTAYPLTKKAFKLGRLVMIAAVITMVFKAPLIPYFLTVKEIGLYNNPLVLFIPHILTAFNLVIMRTFFQQFPAELEEAAVVEGAGYFRTLFSLVLPLSKAVLATLGLFYAVVIWNQFQHPLLFINDPDWFPLQLKIRQFITSDNELPIIGDISQINYNARTLRSVTIAFSIVPIIIVYPFLQKYFVKGAMLGSVKG